MTRKAVSPLVLSDGSTAAGKASAVTNTTSGLVVVTHTNVQSALADLDAQLAAVRYASPNPTVLGLQAWGFDPDGCASSGAVPSAGVLYMAKILIPTTITATGLAFCISAGGTLTANQNYSMIVDSTGTRLAISAAGVMDSAMGTSNSARVPFTSPATITGGVSVWAAWYMNGTLPTVARGTAGSVAELAAAPFRHGRTTATFTTTPPASQSPSTGTVATTPYWVGIY